MLSNQSFINPDSEVLPEAGHGFTTTYGHSSAWMHRCLTGNPSRHRPDHNTHCSVGTIPSTAVICCCSSVSGLPGVGAFAGALLVGDVAIVLTAFDVEADAAGDGTVFCFSYIIPPLVAKNISAA